MGLEARMDRPRGAVRFCGCENKFLEELLFCAVRLGRLGGLVSDAPRMMELSRNEVVGAPAGVKLAAEDGGGGPAGVVDGLSANMLNEALRELRSGVEGAELSLGTSNWYDMAVGLREEEVVMVMSTYVY